MYACLKKVYKFAKTADWTDYVHERDAVDTIVMQTSSGKLRQKDIKYNQDYKTLIMMSISLEQAKKMPESLPNGEGTQITWMVQEKLRRLNTSKKGPGGGQRRHSRQGAGGAV